MALIVFKDPITNNLHIHGLVTIFLTVHGTIVLPALAPKPTNIFP